MTITIHQPRGEGRTWRPEDIESEEPVKYEVVDGNLVLMSPQKSRLHQRLIRAITNALNSAAPADYEALSEITVGYFRPGATSETWREPDVVVMPLAAEAREGNIFDPHDVALAVEIESPSTRAIDRKDKVHEYAAAGIACYWRVEQNADDEVIVHVYEIDQRTGEYALIRSIGPKDTFMMRTPYPVLVDPAGWASA